MARAENKITPREAYMHNERNKVNTSGTWKI